MACQFSLPRLITVLRTRVALFGGIVVALGISARAADEQPNIVFIMADDLGYADLGCYGQENIRTPNLDRLAAEGMRFTHFYAGAAVCAPSRCVLMTGLHTGHARIRGNGPRVGGEVEYFGEGSRRLSLTDEDRTVAEALRSAGYVTGAIGKWGLGEPGTAGTPNRRGFDEWFGYLNQNHAPYYYTDYLWRNERKQDIPENKGGRRERYSHDLLTDEAVSFVRRHRGRPFFLYLPFTIPHRRFEVPSLGDYAGRPWPEAAKIYAAMVTRLDADVGRVLAAVEEAGLARTTLVFFTSDNGAEKKEFGNVFGSTGLFRGFKGSLYEGGLRVPMIVRWPGMVQAGRVSEATAWFADIFPTLLAVAGHGLTAQRLDGRSILPTLRGEQQPELSSRALYWEDPGRQLGQAGRRGRWKAVRAHPRAALELYDLEAEPAEARNVAANHPGVAAEFTRLFRAEHVESPHWPDER